MIPQNLIRLTMLGQTYLNVNGRLVREVEITAPSAGSNQAPSRPDAVPHGRAERLTALGTTPDLPSPGESFAQSISQKEEDIR